MMPVPRPLRARRSIRMRDLTRHTAIITGASSGIRAVIARCFAARGAKLVLAAQRADRLEALGSTFSRSSPVGGDIAQR